MSRWTIAAIVVAVAAIAGVVAIASGSDSEPEGGPDPAAFEEFRDCMSEHGAEVPEPSTGGGPPAVPGEPGSTDEEPPEGGTLLRPDPDDREAFEACSDLLPEPPDGAAPGPQGGPFFGVS